MLKSIQLGMFTLDEEEKKEPQVMALLTLLNQKVKYYNLGFKSEKWEQW